MQIHIDPNNEYPHTSLVLVNKVYENEIHNLIMLHGLAKTIGLENITQLPANLEVLDKDLDIDILFNANNKNIFISSLPDIKTSPILWLDTDAMCGGLYPCNWVVLKQKSTGEIHIYKFKAVS